MVIGVDMSFVGSNYVIAGVFFLFIVLSGFWVGRTGTPPNTFVLTIHKFIGLGMAVFLGSMIYRLHLATPLTASQLVVIAVTVLFFIVNVATGSLLSTDKAMPETFSVINRFFPYLTAASTGVMLYLLS
jgi:hypothetical protein